MYELVNATEMLKKAKAGHYAVGQFNINNLEWTKGHPADCTRRLKSPVILGVSELALASTWLAIRRLWAW